MMQRSSTLPGGSRAMCSGHNSSSIDAAARNEATRSANSATFRRLQAHPVHATRWQHRIDILQEPLVGEQASDASVSPSPGDRTVVEVDARPEEQPVGLEPPHVIVGTMDNTPDGLIRTAVRHSPVARAESPARSTSLPFSPRAVRTR